MTKDLTTTPMTQLGASDFDQVPPAVRIRWVECYATVRETALQLAVRIATPGEDASVTADRANAFLGFMAGADDPRLQAAHARYLEKKATGDA